MTILIQSLDVRNRTQQIETLGSVRPYVISLGFDTNLHVASDEKTFNLLKEAIFDNLFAFSTLQNMEKATYENRIKQLKEELEKKNGTIVSQKAHLNKLKECIRTVYGDLDDQDEDSAWSDM